MFQFLGKSPKATNIEYEDFKKRYDTKSFKSQFPRLFKAAIDDIVNFNKQTAPPKSALNLDSQKTLVEYYVNARLADTEILTKIVFNKLNEFSKLPVTAANHEKIQALDLDTLYKVDIDGKEVFSRTIVAHEAFSNVVSDATKISHLFLNDTKDKYFLRLIVLIVTIRYYPFTIVEKIFQDGKNNIESINKNISALDDHTPEIQTIVNNIDPPPPPPPHPPPPPSAGNTGFFGWLSRQEGGQFGGTNDVASIIEIIETAHIGDSDPFMSQLVKYSTNIFCNALTLLSVSISFTHNINFAHIMPQLTFNIDKYFISRIQTTDPGGSGQILINKLNTFITANDYANIIDNISGIHSTIEVVDAPVVPPPPPPHPGAPRARETPPLLPAAAKVIIDDIINSGFANTPHLNSLADDAVRTSAIEVGTRCLSAYFSTVEGIDKLYSKDVANAIVTVYKQYIRTHPLANVEEAAEIAANKAYNYQKYDSAVSTYFSTHPPPPLPWKPMAGGALDDEYSLINQVQTSIIKGIESSTFFKLIPSTPAPKTPAAGVVDTGAGTGTGIGGQRTQKNRNRNRNRGGTRKNINSIEISDYDGL